MDFSRQSELFDVETFNTPVTIIGAGATGSWLALSLAKMGIKDITVWDFDTIEEHNLPNQQYNHIDIGKTKVQALQMNINISTGIEIKVKNQRYTDQPLTGIVFMMIDTMSGRKQIWRDRIRLNPNIKLYVEPRMGLELGRIYSINPTDLYQISKYEENFYDCLLYTSPSPRDLSTSRMPSSA